MELFLSRSFCYYMEKAKGGAVRTGFMPGSVWRTSLVGQQLYVQDGDRLMSMDVQTEAAGGEASTPLLGPARDCRVRFVRAFNAGTKSVTVLTETGYVYQVGPLQLVNQSILKRCVGNLT